MECGNNYKLDISNGQVLKIYSDGITLDTIQYQADVYKKVMDTCSVAPKFYGIEQNDGKYILKLEYIPGNKLSESFGRNIFKYRKNTRNFGRLHREINENEVSGLITAKEKFETSLLQYEDIGKDSLKKLMLFISDTDKKLMLRRA